MQRSLPQMERLTEESEAISRDLQVTTDRAINLVCDSLILARHLQHAIDLRWRLIMEAKRMSNGMRQRALLRKPEDTAPAQAKPESGERN